MKDEKMGCGCNIEDDGIDTDLLHLLPSFIYEILKSRSKIRSRKHYNDNHKTWLKKQAVKNNMKLRDYLYSLSPEIGTHIETIEVFQNGGEIDSDLKDISDSINSRIEEIYLNLPNQASADIDGNIMGTQFMEDKVQYAQRGAKVDKSQLLNANVQGANFKEGYTKSSDTGFIKAEVEPDNYVEANDCYKLGPNNLPVRVGCFDPEARKLDDFIKSEDGKTYYMREEIAEKKTTSSTKGKKFGDTSDRGSSTKKSDSSYFKEKCQSGCPNTESITIKELRDFIQPKFTFSMRKYLNGIINTATKAGGNDDTVVIIKHGGKDMLHAALVGCFCAYSGEVGPSKNTKVEQDRKVTVVEDKEPKPVEDVLKISMSAIASIELPQSDWEYKIARGIKPSEEDKSTFSKGTVTTYPVKVIFEAYGNKAGQFEGIRILESTDTNTSRNEAISLGQIPPIKAPRNLTPKELTTVLGSGKNMTKVIQPILKSMLKASESKLISDQEAKIKKIFDSAAKNQKATYQAEENGEFSNRSFSTGGLTDIGKEIPFHKLHSGKEMDLQQLLQWKSLQVDPSYLNRG